MRHTSLAPPAKSSLPLPLAPEGVPIIAASLAISGLLVYLWRPLWKPLVALNAFCCWFFRDPERRVPPDEAVIVSPADGKVVAVEEVEDPRFPGGIAHRVSIFLSIFNVHVQRAPIAGRVIEQRYNPGEFQLAFRDKASALNEKLETIISNERLTLKVTQIAGYVARRIVCHLRPGDACARGARMGIIRFGSRVEIMLPGDVVLRVGAGDKVVGGETVIGRLT